MKEILKPIGISFGFVLSTMAGGYIASLGTAFSVAEGAIYVGVISIMTLQALQLEE